MVPFRAGLSALALLASPAATALAAMDDQVPLARGHALHSPPSPEGPLLPMRPELARELRLGVSLAPEIVAGPLAAHTFAPVAAFPPAVESGLEFGGFITYRLDEVLLSGEARAGDASAAADMTAIYRPHGLIGGNTSFRIRIGAEWAEPGHATSYFGPAGGGVDGIGIAPGEGGTYGRSDYNVSFSVSHAILPGLHLSGLAAAAHSPEPDFSPSEGQSHFLFGAGLDLRF